MARVGYGVTGVEAVVVRSLVHMHKTCCEPSRQRGEHEESRWLWKIEFLEKKRYQGNTCLLAKNFIALERNG